MGDKLVGAQQLGHVKRGGDVAALLQLEGGVDYLDLAGPLGLVAGHLYLGAGNQLLIILSGAGHVVEEVGAVLVLGVNGGLVLPPGLLGLYVGLDNYLGVQLGGYVLGVGHNALGLYVRLHRGLVGQGEGSAAYHRDSKSQHHHCRKKLFHDYSPSRSSLWDTPILYRKIWINQRRCAALANFFFFIAQIAT